MWKKSLFKLSRIQWGLREYINTRGEKVWLDDEDNSLFDYDIEISSNEVIKIIEVREKAILINKISKKGVKK